jgi:TPR repeat protein
LQLQYFLFFALLHEECFALLARWFFVALLLACGAAHAQPKPLLVPAADAEGEKKSEYSPYIEQMMKDAEKNDVKAMTELATAYYVGIGVPKNLQEAIKLWRKAADAGSGKALSMLGTLSYQGSGMPKDVPEAIRLWHKAAEKYDTDAMSQIAFAYLVGDTVKKNHTLAYMWFNLASSNGDALATASRDGMAKNLTADMVAEAQNLGNQWVQQHPKPAAQ